MSSPIPERIHKRIPCLALARPARRVVFATRFLDLLEMLRFVFGHPAVNVDEEGVVWPVVTAKGPGRATMIWLTPFALLDLPGSAALNTVLMPLGLLRHWRLDSAD